MKSLFLLLALFIGTLFQTAWAEEQQEKWDPIDKEILAFALVEVEVEAKRPKHKLAEEQQEKWDPIDKEILSFAVVEVEVEAKRPKQAVVIGKKTK